MDIKARKVVRDWATLFNQFLWDTDSRFVKCDTEQAARVLRSRFYKARQVWLSVPELRDTFGDALRNRRVVVIKGMLVFEHHVQVDVPGLLERME